MAGIGFELKKLFKRKGLLATLRAYGYAGIICTGPMLLGIALLLGIIILSELFAVGSHEQDLLVCMITYALLSSLVFTSFLSMPTTRYVADMLFENRERVVLPAFWGSTVFMLIPGCLLYGLFMLFSSASLLQGLLSLWLFAQMIVNWNCMTFLTAIKDYRGIMLSFVAAIVVSFTTGIFLLMLGFPALESLLFAVVLGYGVMLLWDVLLLRRYFVVSVGSPWVFLRWVDRYLPLALTGLFTSIGLFAHLVVVWLGPLGLQVQGAFYGAPYYDVPALVAFITILGTTVNFVVSVEVNFYPKYRSYYALFNDGGVVGDIVAAEEDMLAVLYRELRYTAIKQLVVTAAVISLETLLLNYLPLGFNDLMHGYFRTLCVGYGLYAVGNVMMLILLYFTDYAGALVASVVFALFTTGFTIASQFLDTSYYGFGFLLGAALFFLVALIRLQVFTNNLPYRVLGKQPLVQRERKGLFTRIAKVLELTFWR